MDIETIKSTILVMKASIQILERELLRIDRAQPQVIIPHCPKCGCEELSDITTMGHFSPVFACTSRECDWQGDL